MCKKLVLLISFALMLSLALASGTASANNLIGWWKFDGDTLDYSGFGNDGAAFGNPIFVAGTVGSGALDFDGDDYVRMDGLADDITDNDCTFHAWVKTTDSAGDWFSCNTGTGGNVALWAIDSSQAAMYEGGYQARSTTNVSDGQWHMLTFTRAGSLGTTYVDGVAENTYAANFNFSATDRWSIAQEWDTDSPSDFLTGAVDDVRFYDRAISDAQVWDLFNGIDPAFVKAENPDPADGTIYEDTWASLGWSPGDGAVTHDVYMSDNFDDVNDGTGDSFRGNQAFPFFTVGFVGFPYPDGLVLDTTYYWRIDEVEADGATTHRGDVWSFSIPPTSAYGPSPSDGGRFVDADVTLSWTAGFGAKLHTVYFGDSFDDVDNATVGTSVATTTFTPGTLELDKTYFWRVDEFNPPTTAKGDVWSFTTLPVISITDPDLVGWWTFDEGGGDTAIDWSGHGNDGVLGGDPQWVDGIMRGALDLTNDYVSIDAVADDITTNDITLSAWIKTTQAGEGNVFASNTGGSHVLLFGIDNGNIYVDDGPSTDWPPAVNDDQWHMITLVLSGPRITLYTDGVQVASISTTIDITAETRWSIGQEWDSSPSDFYIGMVDDARFYKKALTAEEVKQIMRGDLLAAWDPSPADNSTSDILRAASVSWSRGDSASQHAVYFGTDRDAVANADTSDTTGVFRGLQAGASYTPPEGVEWAGGPYYWRIDENNTDGTVTRGTVWTFLVANYILVDDFESYNDIPASEAGSNLVYVAWVDGFDNPSANGSTMGYVTGESLESADVHGGRKSVPFQYNNTTAGVSEVALNFTAAQDWTAHGVTTLSLWFSGGAGNVPGQLYVKVNGVQVNYDGDSANLSRPLWQVWNIDLASIGTNLSVVRSLGIGIQGPGATGTLLLDDIRLNQSAPKAPVQIFLDAEAANSITAPMKVYNDPLASGGRYIGTDDGIGDENDNPPADGIATYSFTAEAGTYKIVFRAKPDAGNSFWVRIPGATSYSPGTHGSGWIRFNDIEAGADWHWDEVHSSDHGNAVVKITLPAGQHTLEVARREDGALLDAILITDDVE